MKAWLGHLIFNFQPTAARVGIAALFIGSLFAATAADTPARTFKLTAESPAFWKLFDHKAPLTRVAGGGGFTEDPEGNTYDRQLRLIDCASVLRAIIAVTPEGKYTVLADGSLSNGRIFGEEPGGPNEGVPQG